MKQPAPSEAQASCSPPRGRLASEGERNNIRKRNEGTKKKEARRPKTRHLGEGPREQLPRSSVQSSFTHKQEAGPQGHRRRRASLPGKLICQQPGIRAKASQGCYKKKKKE